MSSVIIAQEGHWHKNHFKRSSNGKYTVTQLNTNTWWLSYKLIKVCFWLPESPYPVGEPLATALDGTSVTLSCKELTSTPPANTTWRRGLQQELIMTGSKYIISEEDPLVKLTILNITKDDEGVYFCHSENPMGVRELEVYLTVKCELNHWF